MAQKIAQYFNPVLAALKKLGGSARPSEVCATVAQDMRLTNAALEETLESGQSRFENKVALESRDLSKLRLQAEVGMEELTVLARSRSMDLSHSRFCFNASDIPVP